MANIIEAITSIVALEKDLKALIESVQKEIQNEKDKKRRKRLAAALASRDLAAIREILFSVD